MASTNVKICTCCSTSFAKRKRDSQSQWESREFCSVLCANRNKKPVTTPADRFWRFVNKAGDAECWNWQGSLANHGYGTLNNGAGKPPVKAHRVSWEIHFGRIPDGMVIRHKCDNPACVNPNHLEPGTQKQNSADMMNRGRFNRIVLRNLRHERAFTSDQADQVRRIVSYGISMAEIAKQFGVDRSTIGLYARGVR